MPSYQVVKGRTMANFFQLTSLSKNRVSACPSPPFSIGTVPQTSLAKNDEAPQVTGVQTNPASGSRNRQSSLPVDRQRQWSPSPLNKDATMAHWILFCQQKNTFDRKIRAPWYQSPYLIGLCNRSFTTRGLEKYKRDKERGGRRERGGGRDHGDKK
ncbi:hypothetical protein BC940DRAFT_287156 [Gongronella butleri]|nr:hypothetical protein BC940DRAFT_287156 [Gongronella butleri]